MESDGLAEIIVSIILLPVTLVMNIFHWSGSYRTFIQRQEPRAQELTKASHGAAVLALAGLLLYTAGAPVITRFLAALRAAPDDPWHLFPALAFAGVVLWGLLWLVSGARRSLAFAGRDSRYLTRAVVKIALGVGLWLAFWHPPLSWSVSIGAVRSVPFSAVAVVGVVAWLTVTGLTKFLLVALPLAGNALRVVRRQLRRNNVAMIPVGERRFRARSWIAFGSLALVGLFWFLW